MTKLMSGCALAVLLTAMGGESLAKTQGGYVREVPVMAAPAASNDDPWTQPPDTPLPPYMLEGTLDAQYVRLQAVHARGGHVAQAEGADRGEPSAHASSGPLGSSLMDAAGAFDDYMTAAASINPAFQSGQQVSHAVDTGVGYEPRHLVAGEVAYAALVALQDPAFVADVRRMAARSPDFAERLLASPSEVMTLGGAQRAAATVDGVLQQRSDAVAKAGRAVKQAAYDVQHQPWSRVFVADPQVVLARVKQESAEARGTERGQMGRLYRSVSSVAPGSYVDAAPSDLVTRGLTLAALAVLGQAGDDNADRLEPLLVDTASAYCLHMAKLNLFQCMAVAGPQYEDLYCVGQHGMMDTGRCVGSSAQAGHAQPEPVILTAAARPEQEYSEREGVDQGYQTVAAPMR